MFFTVKIVLLFSCYKLLTTVTIRKSITFLYPLWIKEKKILRFQDKMEKFLFFLQGLNIRVLRSRLRGLEIQFTSRGREIFPRGGSWPPPLAAHSPVIRQILSIHFLNLVSHLRPSCYIGEWKGGGRGVLGGFSRVYNINWNIQDLWVEGRAPTAGPNL